MDISALLDDRDQLLDRITSPFFLELRPTAKPKTLIFQRKTKAGLWENLLTMEEILDVDAAAYSLRLLMLYRRIKVNKNEAHRIVTYSGHQVFSSYYQKFTDKLLDLLNDNVPFGLSINKGETYFMCHTSKTLKNEAKQSISENFSKLSREHRGIKKFSFAKPDYRDNYLNWGWMIFNDGFKLSIAFDPNFELFEQYKNNYKNPFVFGKQN